MGGSDERGSRPRHGVLCSVLLEPPVETERLPELSLVAGEACAEAIAAVTGLEPEVKLPNDILLGGRKAAGILAEARDGRVVLGIGINVNVTAAGLPAEVAASATSLRLETGNEVDRVELLVELLDQLERRYDEWVAAAARGTSAADRRSRRSHARRRGTSNRHRRRRF